MEFDKTRWSYHGIVTKTVHKTLPEGGGVGSRDGDSLEGWLGSRGGGSWGSKVGGRG